MPVFRVDLAAFPQTLTLDARLEPDGWNGTLATERRCVRLRDIRSVWYRHPSHFEFPEGMSRPERQHAAAEARVGVAGVLCSLDALWVNYPSREADALKRRQLDVARQVPGGSWCSPCVLMQDPGVEGIVHLWQDRAVTMGAYGRLEEANEPTFASPVPQASAGT